MMNPQLKELQEISMLAYELFRYDLRASNLSEKELITQAKSNAQDWMTRPLELLFNYTPTEVILLGRAYDLKIFLKDKLGLDHD